MMNPSKFFSLLVAERTASLTINVSKLFFEHFYMSAAVLSPWTVLLNRANSNPCPYGAGILLDT